MDERFPDEFVTWHHKTFIGVKVDEVFGMDTKSGKAWIELARQIFCEQSENYRVIDHFKNGAPFIEGYPGRISVTHTDHFLAVATLPKTPEVDLELFNPRSAMGIDAEPLNREQVVKVRSKFLSEREMEMVAEKNLKENIIAWTAKEALYKAALIPGLDFKNNIQIKSLPELQTDSLRGSEKNLGEAVLVFPEETGIPMQDMRLFCYESYGCCVTIAFSPKCAKFGKG